MPAHSTYNNIFTRPDLKPVEIEPEVVLRLPECEKLNSTVLRLDEVCRLFRPLSLRPSFDCELDCQDVIHY